MPDDYARAAQEYAAKNTWTWIVSGWFGFPLALLFFVMLFSRQLNAENFGRSVVMMVIGFAMSMFPFSPYATAKRLAAQDKRFNLPIKYIFSNQEILAITSEVEVKEKWSVYQNIFESSRFYFLAQNKQAFRFIPKKAFRSKEQESHFRQMAIRHFSTIQVVGKGITGWKLMIAVGIASFALSYAMLFLKR